MASIGRLTRSKDSQGRSVSRKLLHEHGICKGDARVIRRASSAAFKIRAGAAVLCVRILGIGLLLVLVQGRFRGVAVDEGNGWQPWMARWRAQEVPVDTFYTKGVVKLPTQTWGM